MTIYIYIYIYITNNIYIYINVSNIYVDVKPVRIYVLHNKKTKKTQRFCLKNFYIPVIIYIYIHIYIHIYVINLVG